MRTHIPCTHIGYSRWGLIILLLLGFLLPGCGRKTMPRPIPPGTPPQIQDLSTRVLGQGVELSWTLPSPGLEGLRGARNQFSVLRTEIPWESRDCTDCPVPTEQEVFRLDPAYPQGAELRAERVFWRDGSVAPFRAYRYQVLLLDARGHQLVQSNTSTAKVVPAPATPRDAKATGGPQGILLQWRETRRDLEGKALKGELQYVVERTSQADKWELLSPVPVRGDSFLDSAPAPNHSYQYRITPLVVFEGTSVYGEPILLSGVKAPEALPPPPPATVWVIPSKGGLEVQWTPGEGNPAGYHVYRREGTEIIRLTATPVKNPPFHDRNVRSNVIYGYAVSTVSHPPDQKEGLLSKWAEIRSVSFE